MQRVYLNFNFVNASTTGTFTSQAIDCRSFANLVLYQRGAGTIAGGVVVIEEAPTADYSGTWSDTGATVTPTAVSGTAVCQAIHLTSGAYGFLRARLSTQISGGGTWTLDLVGN